MSYPQKQSASHHCSDDITQLIWPECLYPGCEGHSSCKKCSVWRLITSCLFWINVWVTIHFHVNKCPFSHLQLLSAVIQESDHTFYSLLNKLMSPNYADMILVFPKCLKIFPEVSLNSTRKLQKVINFIKIPITNDPGQPKKTITIVLASMDYWKFQQQLPKVLAFQTGLFLNFWKPVFAPSYEAFQWSIASKDLH